MKKRLMSILICVLLLVMIIPGIANAEGADDPALATESTATYTDQQLRILIKKVDLANSKIENAVLKAQLTPEDDVAQLLATVDGIVAGVMDYANTIGAIVVCEYTTYYIDGQYVLIDPLRIIPL